MRNSGYAGLGEEIKSYWDGRATSYSNGVLGELADDRGEAWRKVMIREARNVLEAARLQGREPRVLDLGCGPGFFTVLFTQMGCQVDAVDTSAEMLDRARTNLAAAAPEAKAAFHQGDIASLPFEDDTFDLAVSRNVTWLMREPEATYAEWLRVLRTGGKFLAFDANWYLYLADPELAAARRADMDGNVLEGWDEEAQATSQQEDWCEQIARDLPLTPVVRPAWDEETLRALGAAVRIDEGIWRELWTPNEQSFYASSPMFMVEAVK